MTETDKTKIRVLEVQLDDMKIQNAEDHKEIKEEMKSGFGTLNSKLDAAIECKADKSEVKDLRDKSWQIIAGIFIAMVTALIGLIVSLVKR